MAVTLTYDSVLSRVQIDANGLAAADEALVERSVDQVQWTTVRGGGAWPVTAGAFDLPLDDYEFAPDVINYYRVRGVETAAMTYVAAGAATTGNNTSLTPALPAGLVEGDLLVIEASIRNSGTGTVNVPAGWALMAESGNLALLGRRYVAGDVAPLVTFTGGAANADTIAQMAAWRRADLTPLTSSPQLNASAVDIAYPAVTIDQDNCVVIYAGWRQDDWTSVATIAGGPAEIGEPDSTAGDDAGQVWDYIIQTTATDIPAGSFVVTGGGPAISRGMVVVLEHAAYLNEQTASTTPAQDGVWLKSIARPFLNQQVQVVQGSRMAVTRPARVGIFNVVGRTLPVAVSDVRLSRRWTMQLRTETEADATNIGYLLASGDVLLIQVPAGCSMLIPAGYVAVGDAEESWHPLRPLQRTFTLPCTEVAPPGPDVVGAGGTWATVLATYGTWEAVIAAHPTWADLLTLIGSPAEVIVP